MATADPVIVAEKMFKEVKQLYKQKEWNEKKESDKMSHFRGMDVLFADFMNKFKIVSRYMILYKEYSTKVFERYLRKLKNIGYKSPEQYAEREADYVKWLYMHYNPHLQLNLYQEVWTKTKKSLMSEKDEFKKMYDQAEKEQKKLDTNLDSELKNDILNMIKTDPAKLALLKDILKK